MKRKTHAEFCEELTRDRNNEFTVLGSYKNCNTDILVKHNVCGYEWEVHPMNLLRGKSKCPQCSNRIPLNHTRFVEKINQLYNNELIVLSNFVSLKDDITVKNIICGHELTTNPKNLLYKYNNSTCNVCNKNERRTHEEFCVEFYKVANNEYEVLGNYVNSKTPILIKHIECNREYEIIPSEFMAGKRCKYCQHRSFLKTDEEFKQEVFDLVGDEYIFLDKYITNKHKIKVIHNKCNQTYFVTPSHFLSGKRCPYCMGELISQKTMRSHEEFCSLVEDLVGNEYIVTTKYNGAHTHLNMKHIVCGSEYSVKPNNFLNGRRCPICNESHGEQIIRRFLINKNITSLPEYTFDDLFSNLNYNLRFDFAVFEDEEKTNLKFLIEYDGEFHYQPIRGEERLLRQQENDELKNQYCIKNNIPLLRIPYWEFDNIESIIENYLDKYNTQKIA